MSHETPKHAEYFEAIIQLRCEKDDLSRLDEVLRFIHNRIKARPQVFISKMKKLDTGVDIYMSSQSYARAIGKKLKKSFKGDLKITRTLHTMDRMTSKQVYRGTILFRLKPKEEEAEEENTDEDEIQDEDSEE
ncbi:MAG: NMD3-related protein [Candidatus Nanoarchaeia archaeon]|jgi:NMD protein affecting ribosome stability and mRNA decay